MIFFGAQRANIRLFPHHPSRDAFLFLFVQCFGQREVGGLIAIRPANLSFEEAAALSFGGANALKFLRDKAGIRRGDEVLIVAALSGG